jgi:hypothetical protein
VLPLAWLSVVAAIALRRKKYPIAYAMGCLALMSCSSDPSDRESSSQSVAPPVVKIVDPIPTFEGGELTVAIGTGREIEARVTPSTAIDRVELSIMDEEPPTPIGRLGHPPFRFFVPEWVIGEAGRRSLCIIAVDAYQRRSEACFQAVP